MYDEGSASFDGYSGEYEPLTHHEINENKIKRFNNWETFYKPDNFYPASDEFHNTRNGELPYHHNEAEYPEPAHSIA